jgi:hypothetical protein
MKWVFTKSLVDALLISISFFSFFACLRHIMALSHETKLHFTTSSICVFQLAKSSVHANMEVWPTHKLLGAIKLTGLRLRIA